MRYRLALNSAAVVLCALSSCVSRVNPAATPPQPQLSPREQVNRWLTAPREWQDLPTIVRHLSHDSPDVRANAMIALLNLWDANRKLRIHKTVPGDFDAPGVTAALSDHFTILPPGYRRTALSLTLALKADRPEAVPLLMYAMADDDEEVRSAAIGARERTFRFLTEDAALLGAYVRFLEYSHVAPRVDDVAMEYFEAQRAAQAATVDILLADLAAGHHGAEGLLRRWRWFDDRAHRVASAIRGLSRPQRNELAAMFSALPHGRQLARAHVARVLASDDPTLRQVVMKFCTDDPNRFDLLPVLLASLLRGHPVGAAVLTEDCVTPAIACRQISDLLQNPTATPPIRLAALETAHVIGLHGPEIHPAVEAMLTNPDDAVRYAAAELLGRADVMKQMRLSALLKDLRGNSPTLRLTAARQLDELSVEPKALTAALVRAIERRDMPVREGILLALERAYASGHDALETLKLLADTDDADGPTRAYARAALREVASAR